MTPGDTPTRFVRAYSDDAMEHHAREGLVAAHEAEANRLLRGLPLAAYDRMLVELRPARLDYKKVLVEPDVPIRDVYFVRDGVASVVAVGQEGGPIEVAAVGPEGFVGLPVLLGDRRMAQRVLVQVEGDAWRMSADAFRRLVDEMPAVRQRFERYAQFYMEQVSQSVACNRLHTLEERCARWLLVTDDRVAAQHFELTHEFMAQMLGVRRAGVTVALGVLQREGMVRASRGRVTVLDRERLEAASCDCYQITRAAQERLLG